MRVAALYDVHGNVPALEAVLGEVERENLDAVVFGGDIASGPFPQETIELVRSLSGARFVRGNADRFELPAPDPEAEGAVRWVREQLDDEKIKAWLGKGAQPTEAVARLIKVKGIELLPPSIG